MTDRDIVQTLIEETQALLAADTDLLAIVKNPGEDVGVLRFHHVWAPPNCTFPYMTAEVTLRPIGTEDGYQEGELRVDVWDASPTSLRMLAMRKRVLGLLNRRIINADECAARVGQGGDFDLSQPEVEVWRRSIGWPLRVYPTAEIADTQAAQA